MWYIISIEFFKKYVNELVHSIWMNGQADLDVEDSGVMAKNKCLKYDKCLCKMTYGFAHST